AIIGFQAKHPMPTYTSTARKSSAGNSRSMMAQTTLRAVATLMATRSRTRPIAPRSRGRHDSRSRHSALGDVRSDMAAFVIRTVDGLTLPADAQDLAEPVGRVWCVEDCQQRDRRNHSHRRSFG